MPVPSPVMPVRSRAWRFLLLSILVVAGVWLLDGRQPAPWSEAEAAWSAHVDAASPVSSALDHLNARAALSPDLPAASLAVLLAVALVTLATLSTLGVPAVLAVAVALSVVFLRSTWSTVAPGDDARAVLVSSLAVLSVVRAAPWWLPALAAVSAVALAPMAAWFVVPALLVSDGPKARRVVSAAALLVCALSIRAWQLHGVWTGIECLAAGHSHAALGDVLVPGVLVDVSRWWSLRHSLQALRGDLHAFGLALAVVGMFATGLPRHLRSAILIVVAVAATTALTGLVPPARAVALLLPWVIPALALGLHTLTSCAPRHRGLGLACGGLAIVAIPILNHAAIAPGAWRTGSPAIAREVNRGWDGGVVATEDGAVTRRLRLVGATTVPADPSTLAACVASGRPVFAVGPMVGRVQSLGFRGTDVVLHASISAVLADLRPGTFVLLGLSPGTVPFVGPQGLRLLERVGLPRSTIAARDAMALIGRVGVGGTSRQGAGGVDLSVTAGSDVAGAPLLAPWSVSAGADDTDIDSPPSRLASSRHAALTVLDRAQDIVMRTAGAARPGLPVALGTHAAWRQVRVDGTRTCQAAGNDWTAVGPHQRLSVPVTGADDAHPAVVWVGTAEAPEPVVRGLPVVPGHTAWRTTIFDREAAPDASRLAASLRDDGLDAGMLGPGRFVTRVSLQPASRLLEGHASISAGVTPLRWVVRLASDATRPEHAEVCGMPDGDRVLDGQSGLVDDDTAREVTVTTRDGWHFTERDRGTAFEWTARPVATATFRATPEHDLVLALDAVGADVGAGPQPVTVRVNGHVLGEAWRGAGRLTVPAAWLEPEVDVLALEVPAVARPATDGRPLGVLVRQLRVIGPAS